MLRSSHLNGQQTDHVHGENLGCERTEVLWLQPILSRPLLADSEGVGLTNTPLPALLRNEDTPSETQKSGKYIMVHINACYKF